MPFWLAHRSDDLRTYVVAKITRKILDELTPLEKIAIAYKFIRRRISAHAAASTAESAHASASTTAESFDSYLLREDLEQRFCEHVVILHQMF